MKLTEQTCRPPADGVLSLWPMLRRRTQTVFGIWDRNSFGVEAAAAAPPRPAAPEKPAA